MYIQHLILYPYQVSLKTGILKKDSRVGALLCITNEKGEQSWAEVAPLPGRSQETLADTYRQLDQKKLSILSKEWNCSNWLSHLEQLHLLPALSFGLESALLNLLLFLPACTQPISALLMGTVPEILAQADVKLQEGYTSAKLKVNQLSFEEAWELIDYLKEKFYLRLDVNRAWEVAEALQFFERYPLDAFDYVEEPFKDPTALHLFNHPLAVDESFPELFSLEQLAHLPKLKALIYKPTIQGGLATCLKLAQWAENRGIQLVLSSSFETDIGLACIGQLAQRLALIYPHSTQPIGLGTYDYLMEIVRERPLKIEKGHLYLTQSLQVKAKFKDVLLVESAS